MGGNEFEEVLSRAGGFWRAGGGAPDGQAKPSETVRSEERDRGQSRAGA